MRRVLSCYYHLFLEWYSKSLNLVGNICLFICSSISDAFEMTSVGDGKAPQAGKFSTLEGKQTLMRKLWAIVLVVQLCTHARIHARIVSCFRIKFFLSLLAGNLCINKLHVGSLSFQVPWKWPVLRSGQRKIVNLGRKAKIDVEHRHLPSTTTN